MLLITQMNPSQQWGPRVARETRPPHFRNIAKEFSALLDAEAGSQLGAYSQRDQDLRARLW